MKNCLAYRKIANRVLNGYTKGLKIIRNIAVLKQQRSSNIFFLQFRALYVVAK